MDRFEKIKELGRGATGTVFKAFDSEKGVMVALKMPDPPPEGIDVPTHYRREIEMLGSLNHDAVVKIIDQKLDSVSPWIAYEFVKGNTLRELITSGKKFEPEEAVRITYEIANGLRYIHDAGIVHRDINPNNIMITTEGQVKIMDFGIAHRLGEPYPKQLAGTPGYMSPETAKGEEGLPESDLYSLGLIFYEMLAGEPVYTGESIPQVIAKILSGDFISLEKKKPDLKPEIHAIVKKLLENNSKNRFKSADELLKSLSDVYSKPAAAEKEEKQKVSSAIEIPPKLIGLAGPYKGYELDMGATITTFGGEYADIDLSLDPTIAPQHCWIVPEDGAFWLYDAEDSGGTFLAGRAIKKARLRNGDRITIGTSTFKWDNPTDTSPAYRGPDEIEPANLPHGNEPGTSISQGGRTSSGVNKTGMHPVIRTLIGTIAAVVILFLLYGYFLVPAKESKDVALKLEDYWIDFSSILNASDPVKNIDAIKKRSTDFSYNNLETTELSKSIFLVLPGPSKTRAQNLTAIQIVIKTCDAFNIIRKDIPASEKKAQIDQSIQKLGALVLPEQNTWDERRLRILAWLAQISAQLETDAVTEAAAVQTQTSAPNDASLTKLLDGYYLFEEASGKLSNDLALEAFNDFQEAKDKSSDALSANPNDGIAKSITILSDYFMVRIRMDHIATWESEFINGSIDLLTQGRNMLNAMSDQEWDANVPSQIDNPGYNVKGRLLAKYMTLIDEFQQKTGATVPTE